MDGVQDREDDNLGEMDNPPRTKPSGRQTQRGNTTSVREAARFHHSTMTCRDMNTWTSDPPARASNYMEIMAERQGVQERLCKPLQGLLRAAVCGSPRILVGIRQ